MYIVAKDHTYLGEWKNSSYTFCLAALEGLRDLKRLNTKVSCYRLIFKQPNSIPTRYITTVEVWVQECTSVRLLCSTRTVSWGTATTATVYGRLLHDMAVSRFDRWPKLPKLTHLGVLLPCMSVKYLFTVTRWDLPKKFVKSFAESLDLYRFFDE